MLTLIGLGIWDEGDVSMKGMEIAEKADVVYAELYTANWGGSLKRLEKIIEKKIIALKRSDMEEKSGIILKEAKEKDVVVFVPGDPLIATTHSHIIIDAKKNGIPVKIVHASSVYTVVAECGLGIYNFGRTATIVTHQKGYEPSSFYDVIGINKKSGLHTLMLLDIDMDVKEGIETLTKIEEKEKKGFIRQNTEIIAMSRIGSKDQKIVFGKAKDVAKKTLGNPAVIIIPGKLHFLEKEFLEKIISS